MDIKIKGISKETMSKAVIQGQQGIEKILLIMSDTLSAPREISVSICTENVHD